MTSDNHHADSDSVNLGSNPSSPATTNADVSGVSSAQVASEQPELSEQSAHTGRTEVGTVALPSIQDIIKLSEAELHAKRNEWNALARQHEEAGRPDLGNWYRLLAQNLLLIADPAKRDRGIAAYEKNKFRFERDKPGERSQT